MHGAPHATSHHEAHGRAHQERRDAGSNTRTLAAPDETAHTLQRRLLRLLRYHVGPV